MKYKFGSISLANISYKSNFHTCQVPILGTRWPNGLWQT